MRLWAGLSTHFISDAVHNQIAEKLKAAFLHHYRYEPPQAEVASWRNSLRATAQVFEEASLRDHDLTYDLDSQCWVGTPAFSYDTVVKRSKGQFVDLVKNTYRVLLTRGLKGCYACFTDKDTERFVRSRVESA